MGRGNPQFDSDLRYKVVKEKNQIQTTKQLIDAVDKHFNTAIIGALSAFEKHYPHLAEEDADEGETTQTWSDMRKAVLDAGNLQRRLAIDKMKQRIDGVVYNKGDLVELVIKAPLEDKSNSSTQEIKDGKNE